MHNIATDRSTLTNLQSHDKDALVLLWPNGFVFVCQREFTAMSVVAGILGGRRVDTESLI